MKAPPIGIKPEWIHIEQRANDLMNTIARYVEADQEPNSEWMLELKLLASRYNQLKGKAIPVYE